MLRGLLWWSTVENTPANGGDMSLIPGAEGFHVPGTPPVHHNHRAHCAPTTEPTHPRAQALQQEKPLR